jgi:hypothetical protein
MDTTVPWQVQTFARVSLAELRPSTRFLNKPFHERSLPLLYLYYRALIASSTTTRPRLTANCIASHHFYYSQCHRLLLLLLLLAHSNSTLPWLSAATRSTPQQQRP